MIKEIVLLTILLFIYTIIFNYKGKLSKIFNLIDKPDIKRKIHLKPTPLIGGFIILIIIIFNFNYFKNYLPKEELLVLFSLVFLYFLTSIIDDIKDLNSYFRLIFLFFGTYFILGYSDIFVLKDLNFKFQNLNISLNHMNIFVSSLCILLLVNALNLADGINGLSTLLIIFWTIYLKIFLFNDNSYVGFSSLIILMITFYHIYKGKYFMGDYGVTVAAMIIGIMSIASYNLNLEKTNPIFVEEIFLLFFIPGLDMFRLFVERIINKKDPFSADKNHLHHFLIKKFELRKSLLIYFVISLFPIFLYKVFNLNSLILIILFTIIFFLIFYTKLKNIFY